MISHKSEELFQEAFLAVWTKRHQYEFPRPFKAWLYAIAANQCRADYRRRGSIVPAPLEETCAPDLSPAETAVQTETAALVETAVAQLPHQQRVVVVLRVWEGLPYAKIAQIVDRSEATVRSHMHHGLAALRKYLEPRLKS